MNVDTLSIARDLRAAELPPEQAEAIPAAIGRAINEGAATRSDVEALSKKLDSLEAHLTAKVDSLDTKLSSKIETVDAQLTSKIDNSRSSLLTWLIGVIFATAGVLIAVMKL